MAVPLRWLIGLSAFFAVVIFVLSSARYCGHKYDGMGQDPQFIEVFAGESDPGPCYQERLWGRAIKAAVLGPFLGAIVFLLGGLIYAVSVRSDGPEAADIPATAQFQPGAGRLAAGGVCLHEGENANYCTRCWTPLKSGLL